MKSYNINKSHEKEIYSSGWLPVWADEFDTPTIDGTKWNIVNWEADKNNELQYYIPENVSVREGFLRITSDRKTYKGKAYTSGAIETKGKFSLLYGKVEIRARLPLGQGVFPAFWTLPENGNSLPEIDIMELLGNKPDEVWMVYHWINKDGRQKRKFTSYQGIDFSKDFNTFSLIWEQDKLIWLINEKIVFSITEDIPDTPLYIYINTAVGGDWPGRPDSTTLFPQYLDIDYIRVFKNKYL